jgi:Aspartyl protease
VPTAALRLGIVLSATLGLGTTAFEVAALRWSPDTAQVGTDVALRFPAETKSLRVSQARSDVLVISFEISRKRPSLLVQVSINGMRRLLVLDTGSAHTVIQPELVGIKPSKPAGTAQAGAAFIGDAVGAAVTLQVGNRIWQKYRIVAMDLSKILAAYQENLDGVLGLDFLQHFHHVGIDFHNHRIELTS